MQQAARKYIAEHESRFEELGELLLRGYPQLADKDIQRRKRVKRKQKQEKKRKILEEETMKKEKEEKEKEKEKEAENLNEREDNCSESINLGQVNEAINEEVIQ